MISYFDGYLNPCLPCASVSVESQSTSRLNCLHPEALNPTSQGEPQRLSHFAKAEGSLGEGIGTAPRLSGLELSFQGTGLSFSDAESNTPPPAP